MYDPRVSYSNLLVNEQMDFLISHISSNVSNVQNAKVDHSFKLQLCTMVNSSLIISMMKSLFFRKHDPYGYSRYNLGCFNGSFYIFPFTRSMGEKWAIMVMLKNQLLRSFHIMHGNIFCSIRIQ
jgi:chlorite dismutase